IREARLNGAFFVESDECVGILGKALQAVMRRPGLCRIDVVRVAVRVGIADLRTQAIKWRRQTAEDGAVTQLHTLHRGALAIHGLVDDERDLIDQLRTDAARYERIDRLVERGRRGDRITIEVRLQAQLELGSPERQQIGIAPGYA